MGCCCVQNLREVDEIDQNLTDSRVKLTYKDEALALKEKGNDHFKKKAYQNAIKCYIQALNKNPNELVYYTNLALAFKVNSQFQEAIKTIDRMQRHQFPVTPNYNQLMIKGKVTKARCINSLAKKYILNNHYTTQESENMLQKVQNAIKILEEVKKNSQIEADEFLNNSLKIKIYLGKIKKNTSESQLLDYLRKKINASRKGLHNQKGWEKVNSQFANQQALLLQVQNMYVNLQRKFIQEAEEDQEYLIDPITYEKFKDPVIVPSGISYEEDILRQYFKKGQYKDPITKQKFQVGEKVIVKNYSIKNYISQMGKMHQLKKEDIQILVC